MENIFLPSKIELKKGKTPNEGVLIMEPLYHGYGTTIGNALRRVLLSSLPGAAVTSFKIKGVQHEFSSVDGIYEDVLELSLNLKQLRLKLHSDEPVVLKLTKKGEGAVLAKDIGKDANVEIINQDLQIATITDKKMELDMEITVEKGRGFDPTENRDKEKLPVGSIAIDAIYTPIKDIGYKVEYTRVGQITNYDKLTLNLETDGTITPEEAINAGTKILIDHFSLLYKEEETKEKKETKKTTTKKTTSKTKK
ncbi:MAG: DNA-directed RNA polymerase subunit alpha [Candidatus Buchananbacteria bacterium]|nr:DNA-directed RNA polymerase subunit alpha [Candidatus Buchananbacteria bacterium]